MSATTNLSRFINAQKSMYESALSEIKNGKKTGHWIWYIFPQIQGLGLSETSRFFALKNEAETKEYLNHPVLGKRLIEMSNELLNLKTNDSIAVFGSTDSMKLKSSMTLFSLLENTNSVFQLVLEKFFGGLKDERTIDIMKRS